MKNINQEIQLGLALLPLVQTGVEQFIAWLQRLRTAAQQSGEWTPEQDAAFEASLLERTSDPAYQPDPGTEPEILPPPAA